MEERLIREGIVRIKITFAVLLSAFACIGTAIFLRGGAHHGMAGNLLMAGVCLLFLYKTLLLWTAFMSGSATGSSDAGCLYSVVALIPVLGSVVLLVIWLELAKRLRST